MNTQQTRRFSADINLDDPYEIAEFLDKHNTTKGRALANALDFHGKFAVRAIPTDHASRNGQTTFNVGEHVRIVGVQFPQHEHHARFIGTTGIVKRVYKTKPFVVVTVDQFKKDRECYPHFLARLSETDGQASTVATKQKFPSLLVSEENKRRTHKFPR